jgi:murein DD-endopeptidase MepM/ murein hydrolase activator NlpD
MRKAVLLSFAFLLLLFCNKSNLTKSDETQTESKFRFPLDEWVVIQEFGNFNNNANRYHTAEDARAAAGTKVYSIADGEISYSGPASGYGWLIIIDHAEHNVYSLYGHVSTKRWKKEEGSVKKGELIAYIADDDEDGSGVDYWDWGSHLHFGIRNGSRYDYPGDASDNRFTAGYTFAKPTELDWLDPTDFIKSRIK